MSKAPIRLVVGLGNPGPQYADTRHNAGAWFVLHCHDRLQASPKQESKFMGSLARSSVHQSDCRFFIPSTYMNESGRALQAVTQFFKFKPAEILVVHDELDHPPGSARLKWGGGHGGHNGLRDIIRILGSSDFPRLRIGIGHPGAASKVSNFVLSSPTAAEHADIFRAIDLSFQVLPDLCGNQWEQGVKALHDQINQLKLR